MSETRSRADVTGERLMEIRDACEVLDVTRATIDDLIRDETLHAYRLPESPRRKGGKRYLVEREVIDLARRRGLVDKRTDSG